MNLSNLDNIAPPPINNSLINDSTQLVPNLISNSNNLTDGYFALGMMVIIFIHVVLLNSL